MGSNGDGIETAAKLADPSGGKVQEHGRRQVGASALTNVMDCALKLSDWSI